MDYNFDKRTDRRNTGCMKWDVKENELPMWVADMDFETAPQITQAHFLHRSSSGDFKHCAENDLRCGKYRGTYTGIQYFLQFDSE